MAVVLRLSHVAAGVHDLDAAEAALCAVGLGVWRFPGDVGAHVPLAGWQYVELDARSHPVFRHPGWQGWSVAVDDLDRWIAGLGLDDVTPFGVDPTRTFSPWRGRFAGTTRARASGGVLPYLIEYDPAVDMDAVFAEKHRAAAHEVEVATVARLVTDGAGIVDADVVIDGAEVPMPLT